MIGYKNQQGIKKFLALALVLTLCVPKPAFAEELEVTEAESELVVEAIEEDSLEAVTEEETLEVITEEVILEEADYSEEEDVYDFDPSAPGNSIETAFTANLGTVISGSIDAQNQADYYRFTLPSSGRVVFDAVTESGDGFFSLYAADGKKEIYLNEYEYIGDDQYEERIYQELIGGTYYLQFSSENLEYKYHFKLQFTSANESFAETVTDKNNSISTADEIMLDTMFTGFIAANDKVDYYKFVLPTNCYVEVNATVGHPSGLYGWEYLYWSIYDSNGNRVYSGIPFDDEGTSRYLFSAGTYFISFGMQDEYGVYQFALETEETDRSCVYTITYDANGGTGAPDSQTKYAANMIRLSTVIPEKTCTITYDANGGSCSVTKAERTCTFEKWANSLSEYAYTYKPGAAYNGNGNVTLYAIWTGATYGELPTARKSGSSFAGWFTDPVGGTSISSTTKVTEDTTIYAHWTSLAPEVEIVQQPSNIAARIGASASFQVNARYVEEYQWFFSNDGKKWYRSGSTGNSTDILTVKVKEETADRYYRCRLMDGNGKTVYTNAVRVNLLPSLRIKSQPEVVSARIGKIVQFQVVAENADSYQWYFSADNGQHWYKSGMTGNATDTLSFKVTESNANRIYKCKLTDAYSYSIYTNIVYVNLIPTVSILEQPESVRANIGDTVQFHVVGKNVAVYQWYYSVDNGQHWYKSGMTGNATDTLTFKVTERIAGRLYRCKLTDAGGKSVLTEKVGDGSATM